MYAEFDFDLTVKCQNLMSQIDLCASVDDVRRLMDSGEVREIMDEIPGDYWQSVWRYSEDAKAAIYRRIPAAVPHVDLCQETAYGLTTRLPFQIRVF